MGIPTKTESFFREYRRTIASISGLSIVTALAEMAALSVVVAYLEGVATERANWQFDLGPIDATLSQYRLAWIAAGAIAIMTFGRLILIWLGSRFITEWRLNQQTHAVEAFLRTSFEAQLADGSGALQTLVNRAGQGAQAVRSFIAFLTALGSVLIFAVGAFVVFPAAAIALILVGIALFGALVPIRRAGLSAAAEAIAAKKDTAESIDESHRLIQEIRVNRAEESSLNETVEHLRRDQKAVRRSWFLADVGSLLYRSAGLGMILAGATVASRLEDLDLTRLGIAGLLLLRSLAVGQSVQTMWQRYINQRPNIDLAAEVVDRYRHLEPRPGTKSMPIGGPFEVDSMSYSYNGDENTALANVSISIDQDEAVGVIGPSGAGKSTLARVLLGLFRPDSGSYQVDGTRVSDIRSDEWFSSVAFVPQQPEVLRATVAENISFFRAGVSERDVHEAAMAAGLHDEIVALPLGYDTEIGRGARDLSIGQRQRLGIARALAGSPRLLVLDEPTSALDTRSEVVVQETLARLRGTLSIVIIAHRLSTLDVCDRIVVLTNGQVEAFGTPDKVAHTSAFYRESFGAASSRPEPSEK